MAWATFAVPVLCEIAGTGGSEYADKHKEGQITID